MSGSHTHQFRTRLHRTGRLHTPHSARIRRSLGARGALFLVLMILLAAAGKLQLMEADKYRSASKNNRLRPLMIQAPRGTIFDRHGQVIAENVPAYQVLLMPGKPAWMNAQIERLQPLLGLTNREIQQAQRKWQRQRHLPMVLTTDASPSVVARLEEAPKEFPGVLLFEYAKRRYPAGQAVAHFIGYVSEISEDQMKDSVKYSGYGQGQWIGQQGLERQYERQLAGAPGINYLEIDAMGRIKRWLPEELGMPSIPGRDLQLYLDLDLQRFVQTIFPKKYNGAFVALDPHTGGVLAYYSHPSYDPNYFTGGISFALYDSLYNHPDKPLIDRVAGSQQPPASTWKLPVAAMALEEKVIRPEEFMPIPCTGGLTYGRYARCWDPRGHGRSDLVRGIMLSCDVYFYQVGIRMSLKRFLETGTKLGFQKRTGIDLPTEVRNTFPENLQWWVKHQGYMPKDNEVLSMAIGQGPVTMTPLKMAHLYSALARSDGKALAPRLAVTEKDSFTLDLGVSKENIEWLRKGMRRVIGPGGTAQLTRLPYWDAMGKTGTAQACANCSLKDHAWFVGMAGPAGKDPEIVAVMFLQHGEHGWGASDYVAAAINFYLNRKYGRPFEMYATPRQRFARGLYVDTDWLYSPVVDPIPGVGWPEKAVRARARTAPARVPSATPAVAQRRPTEEPRLLGTPVSGTPRDTTPR
jgi:penicillin-binding protein 2